MKKMQAMWSHRIHDIADNISYKNSLYTDLISAR